MVEQSAILIARNDLPVHNLQEFIAYAKANHAGMQYGSAGIGSFSQLVCELLHSSISVASRTSRFVAQSWLCRK